MPDAQPSEPTDPPGGSAGAFDPEEMRQLVQRFFRVYEVERDIRGLPGTEIAAYYVQTDPATFTARFEQLREAIRQKNPDLLVILQHRLGEDVILVARRPPIVEKGNTLNVVLLALTILTTTLAGALFYQGYDQAERLLMLGSFDASFLHPRLLGFGFLTFSLPLILILGIHELGHYFVAKRHRVRTSPPFFIPVPPFLMPFGTFGAFISMREPIPDRKALFDIGASGPIAGFLLAIPVLVIGMVLTAFYQVPVPPDDEFHAQLVSPDSSAIFGYNQTWDPQGVNYTSTDAEQGGRTTHRERLELNFTFLYPSGPPAGSWRYQLVPFHLRDDQRASVTLSVVAPNATPAPGDFSYETDRYVAHLELTARKNLTSTEYLFLLPEGATQLVAEFSWKMPPPSVFHLGDSLLVIGIQNVVNVFLPLDQDVFMHPTGIAGWVGLLVTGFNLLPAGQLDGGHVARAVLGDRMRWASYASVALMFLLAYQNAGWFLMAVLLLFLGLNHPPPLNDKSPLDLRRRIVAALVLALLLATFVPFPFGQ